MDERFNEKDGKKRKEWRVRNKRIRKWKKEGRNGKNEEKGRGMKNKIIKAVE